MRHSLLEYEAQTDSRHNEAADQNVRHSRPVKQTEPQDRAAPTTVQRIAADTHYDSHAEWIEELGSRSTEQSHRIDSWTGEEVTSYSHRRT